VAIYGWVDWIVECNLPLTAVNNEHFRKYSKLQTISIKTFIKYLDKLSESAAEKLAKELPKKFGLVFDGWSGPRNRHF
jgi:hypothetical protein